MKKNTDIGTKQRLVIARDIAIVFQYMHNLGIVHRDIKSHNILIDDKFNVKVCDFGLAKFNVSTRMMVYTSTYRLTSAKDLCSTLELLLIWLLSCFKSVSMTSTSISLRSAVFSGKSSTEKCRMTDWTQPIFRQM